MKGKYIEQIEEITKKLWYKRVNRGVKNNFDRNKKIE